MDIGVDELRAMHLRRGFDDIGYHWIVTRDGIIRNGRDTDNDGNIAEEIGAHAYGYNQESVSVCWIGSVDEQGNAVDNRTDAQVMALLSMAFMLRLDYPKAELLGHRDLSPDLNGDGRITRFEWMKQCPCYDVRAEYIGI